MSENLQELRSAIRQAMEYAVSEADLEAAEDMLEMYREDRIGLSLLREFYSYLPEAREDWIREIRLVNRHRGIFLLTACTTQDHYLYLVSSEGLEFQGSMADGFLATELLDFFGYDDLETFAAVCAAPHQLAIYEPIQLDQDICPACHAVTGEYHELGCPVELCPWCGGQLIHCDCRYEQLEVDALQAEEDLVRFEALLEERGRIPYAPEQRPNFASEDPNIVFEE